jgi:hypothetical protein
MDEVLPKRSVGCRRQYGRRYQDSLYSDLGPVLDLSAGGMRVLAARVPRKAVFKVTLMGLETTVTLKARVAWSRRRGFGKRELGLEFVEMDAETRTALTRISSAHRYVPPNAA